MSFDPWHSSFEDAQCASDDCRGAHNNPCDPLLQWSAAQEIERLKASVDAGNGFAVLACIRKCVTHGLVAPEWLALAFNRRYDHVLHARAKSWDASESFGRPYPKGTNLNAQKKRRDLGPSVWCAVHEIKQKDPGRAIGPELFEEIGKEFGIGKTLAEEYFYEQKKRLEPKA